MAKTVLLKSAFFEEQEIHFYSNENHADQNYYSVLIGANAVGKSRLLRSIIQSLRLKREPKLKTQIDIKEIINLSIKVDNSTYNINPESAALFPFHSGADSILKQYQ